MLSEHPAAQIDTTDQAASLDVRIGTRPSVAQSFEPPVGQPKTPAGCGVGSWLWGSEVAFAAGPLFPQGMSRWGRLLS